MRKWGILFLFLVGIQGLIFAQQAPEIKVNYRLLPRADFDASASFPQVFSRGKTVFVNTVRCGYTVYDLDDWGVDWESAGDTAEFYSLTYTLVYMQQFSAFWSFMARSSAGLASDFEKNISGDDISFSEMLILMHRFSSGFSLGGGALYSLRAQEVYPLPFLVFEWIPVKGMKIAGIVPDSIRISFIFQESTGFELFLKKESFNYHGNPDKYRVDNPRLVYTNLIAGSVLRVTVSESIKLNFECGYAFGGKFKLYNGHDKEMSIDTDPEMHAKIGLSAGI
ncbi:DUF6268 family outer membrane beta-barrel protein [Marispirochaeta sp.]|uniref:DUF6268 family outer membrane beta-barrel protein n=1 Tax=Marispirochaeta sp. TaxID=2038653 RepID=UPI0029C6C4E3|nr:DUF6268 family outer membrane beta-barrel protein [Marispirochaeta sp.]